VVFCRLGRPTTKLAASAADRDSRVLKLHAPRGYTPTQRDSDTLSTAATILLFDCNFVLREDQIVARIIHGRK
jgi:hypothetical protein